MDTGTIKAVENELAFLYAHGIVKYEDRSSGHTASRMFHFYGEYNPNTKRFERTDFGNEAN